MNLRSLGIAAAALALTVGTSSAASTGQYTEAIARFRSAVESSHFFSESYGYAVFPNIAEGAVGVGGAYGKGRVYVHGRYIGDTSIGQVSVGFQAGGKVYSEIIFFQDKRALDEFKSGTFEFGAGASAVAITAGANAGIATNGASAGASAGPSDAKTQGVYQKGMAVFSIAKGGLMYAANVAGQKFSYTPRSEN